MMDGADTQLFSVPDHTPVIFWYARLFLKGDNFENQTKSI
jgi:hypothetical protein